MMCGYDVFGARMTTADGGRLAAAGLCRGTELSRCEAALDSLRALRLDTEDPEEIDRRVAEKLTSLYGGIAVAVGATVCLERIRSRVCRTGGVLGRPEAETADAENELEQLDDGIWMYTISGGPGWVGFFTEDKARRLADETYNHSVAYPARVNEIYRSLIRLSPDGYLLISDGTGYDSFGLCAAKLGEKELGFVV